MPIINSRVPITKVIPGLNIPMNIPTTLDENEIIYNCELDCYEPYNKIADEAGCYDCPSDWDSDDFEHSDEDFIDRKSHDTKQKKGMSQHEKDLFDDVTRDNGGCLNDFNCIEHCHCDNPGYVCFFCKLSQLKISVRLPTQKETDEKKG